MMRPLNSWPRTQGGVNILWPCLNYQKSGDLLGTLRSFETSPAHIPNFRLDGTFVEVPYLDRVDVICEIEVEGLLTDDGFMVGGSDYIGCGSSILVRSLNLETEWLVLDIEVSGT